MARISQQYKEVQQDKEEYARIGQRHKEKLSRTRARNEEYAIMSKNTRNYNQGLDNNIRWRSTSKIDKEDKVKHNGNG